MIKPIIVAQKADLDQIITTKSVLYFIIDQALRMISVFMPFLCEEMFQRIPRWADEANLQSIMHADMPRDCKVFNFGDNKEYAQYDEVCTDSQSLYYKLSQQISDAGYEVIKPMISAPRQIIAQYKMQAQKLKFYIQTETALNQEQLDIISTLVNAESVELIDKSQKQKGWGSVVVDEKTTVFADLKGKIDVAGEIQKLLKE